VVSARLRRPAAGRVRTRAPRADVRGCRAAAADRDDHRQPGGGAGPGGLRPSRRRARGPGCVRRDVGGGRAAAGRPAAPWVAPRPLVRGDGKVVARATPAQHTVVWAGAEEPVTFTRS